MCGTSAIFLLIGLFAATMNLRLSWVQLSARPRGEMSGVHFSDYRRSNKVQFHEVQDEVK